MRWPHRHIARRTARRTVPLAVALLIAGGLVVCAETRGGHMPTEAEVYAPPGGGAEREGPEYEKRRALEEHEGVENRGAEHGRTSRFGATCRTDTKGSRATASCHNPYPETDRVRLHVECERWWDIDTDSAPVEIAPAGYTEFVEWCWKEIREVWITHERLAS
ncbi:hypothetical protein [Streptomyces sp. NPDC056244]|uniref:hypothetical protein n=1 Tax=unclassified Streptomyces TaxID=2593676 RepID=UPI0035DFB035